MKKFLILFVALIAVVSLSAQDVRLYSATPDTLTNADTVYVNMNDDLSDYATYVFGIKSDTLTGTGASTYNLYGSSDGTYYYKILSFTNGHRPLDTVLTGTIYWKYMKLEDLNSGTNTQKYWLNAMIKK